MAIVSGDGLVIRGKVGQVTFVYRKGTNFTRLNTDRRDAKSPAQLAQRGLYGQIQRLGSLWNRDFIAPYFQGNLSLESPYNRYIKYNWPLWDKSRPAWQCALPFWNVPLTILFFAALLAGESPDTATLAIMFDIPADLIPASPELYGFWTAGDAANFTKLTPRPVTAPGEQTFDFPVPAAAAELPLFCVCWLQASGTTRPLTMPANIEADYLVLDHL
jgi:hypothetical protein